jgi:hypothetical protein
MEALGGSKNKEGDRITSVERMYKGIIRERKWNVLQAAVEHVVWW